MSKIVTLVSLETLKNEFGFDLNSEQQYILPNIYKCQRFIIKQVLGDEKYDSLSAYVEQFKIDGIVNAEYDKLIDDYIAPAIAYYVKSEIVFNTAYKMKNQSVEPSGDRFGELIKISKKYLADSDGFIGLLKEYMCDNNLTIGEDYIFRSTIFLGNTSYADKSYKSDPSKNLQNKYYNRR